MKITSKDIKAYRRKSRKEWHDAEWHEFMLLKSSEAIGYADSQKSPGDGYKEIAQSAMKYLEDTQGDK